ncbi:MAG: T9SS type A sorting domain-containing protein [Candidatus Marinimicrobia bacterium]|nr:T9SS type A sorting domain-containing protein [Candidatus Neomarinimicrobiota bacterium]
MKKITFILLVLWGAFTILPAQTAADYYLPLRMGNSLVYRSGAEESGWAPRTGYETIEGTDSVHGELYYKLVGSSIMDDAPADTHVSHVFWMREDSLGNVLLVAMSGESTDIDSAMVYPIGHAFFSNDILTPGHSFNYEYEDISMLDSTISNTETVVTSIGTFTNCLKRLEYRVDSTGTCIWEQYRYFAENVGEIKKVRVYPNPHTDLLIEINFQTAVEKQIPNEFRLHQNYPNPFNPVTRIDYSIPVADHVVMKVYNIHGKEIQTLINKNQLAGSYSLIFNAGDLASGIYIYTLKIGSGIIKTNKMLLLK